MNRKNTILSLICCFALSACNPTYYRKSSTDFTVVIDGERVDFAEEIVSEQLLREIDSLNNVNKQLRSQLKERDSIILNLMN